MISINYITIVLILLSNNIAFDDKEDFKGTYSRLTVGTPMKFQKTLLIRCDSTVTTTFSGDMMTESLTGEWEINSDTITVKLNPKITENGKQYFPHWQEVTKYLIKNNKLIPIQDQVNGQKITDQQLLKELNKNSKKYSFNRTEKVKCE